LQPWLCPRPLLQCSSTTPGLAGFEKLLCSKEKERTGERKGKEKKGRQRRRQTQNKFPAMALNHVLIIQKQIMLPDTGFELRGGGACQHSAHCGNYQ